MNDLGVEEDFTGTERYSIQRRLGAGAYGVVYEAYDRERNTVVALKTLRQASAEALYFFKREFRALADVVHPNLVALYDLMSEREEWFFTMELVEGKDMIDTVRGVTPRAEAPTQITPVDAATPPPPNGAPPRVAGSALSFAQEVLLRGVMMQLVDGILALHDAGKLHRDIKPSNVMVTPLGRLVLLDFGLVGDIDSKRLHDSGGVYVRGTPAYMSPEQGKGQMVSAPSDWYSVGVVLYEALTGLLPFDGPPLDVLLNKQKYEPLPPSQLVAGLPGDLDTLCADLLRLAPEARPSGREVLRRLGGDHATAKTYFPARAAVAAKAVPLIGRGPELEALRRAFRKASAGEAVTVFVHGGSGVGKSALVRHFLDEIEGSGRAVVLTGRCHERESVPYKALDGLVDALSQHLKRLPLGEAEALLPRDVLALARLFPVLRQVEAVSAARRRVLDIPNSQELRRRAFAALRELLERLAERLPVVLAIDDLQWGDFDSAILLAELLRPPDPPPLLVICAYRSEEAAASPLLQALRPPEGGGGDLGQVAEIVLGPLAFDAARQMALAIAGDLSEERATAIARDSAGNPFFIDELIRYALTAPGMSADEARELAAAGGGSDSSINDVIHARVARLPEEARIILEVLAVAGQPLDLAVAKRAAQLMSDGTASLDVLRAARLVRARGSRDGDKAEVLHNRVREAVVACLPPGVARKHHRNLALAWEASGRADPEALAVHFRAAGDEDRAGAYAVEAAEKAVRALAFDRAADLYRTALEIRLEATRDPRPLLIKLGETLASAGRGAEAGRAFLDAAQWMHGGETLDLQRRAADQFLRSGHLDEGLETARTLLASIGMKLAATPLQALASLLLRRTQIRLRGLRFREREIAQVAPAELLRIDTCWAMASGLAIVDTIRGADFQTRHLLLALACGEPYRAARALACETGYSATGGNRTRRRTLKLIALARELATKSGHPHAIGLAMLTEGLADFLEARWQRAVELGEAAEGILRERCTGISWELDTAHYFVLESVYYLGEINRLSARLPALLQEAQEHGDLYGVTTLRTRFMWIPMLVADRPERAEEELHRALDQWTHRGFHHQHLWALSGKVETALYRGEGEKALALVEEKWPAISRSLFLRIQKTFIQTQHLRARAALAAAGMRPAAERQRLFATVERDARRIERTGIPVARALAEALRGGVAAARGETAAAIDRFQSAESGFAEAGMQLFAAAAQRCRGALTPGAAGAALLAAADAEMARQRIRNPERMTAMLVPGANCGTVLDTIGVP